MNPFLDLTKIEYFWMMICGDLVLLFDEQVIVCFQNKRRKVKLNANGLGNRGTKQHTVKPGHKIFSFSI